MSRFHDAIPKRIRQSLRYACLGRDGYRCRKCGKAGILECDHIVPLHKNGYNTLCNMQTLCKTCHSLKTLKESSKDTPTSFDEWHFYFRRILNE